ncbi:MAG: hypothetical protein RR585_06785 [Coprobacillus sp.]
MSNYLISRPLSQKGISQIIRKLETMQRKMPQLEEEFKRRSLDYLEKRARYYIFKTTGGSSWYTLTHTLENSWIKDYSLGTLVNNCWYSAIVEFGSGISGQGTHPQPKDYQYDVNGHGEDGWYFFDEQGALHFTTGMQAHRYMFDAIQDYVIGNEYKKIFEKSFNAIMGGILK